MFAGLTFGTAATWFVTNLLPVILAAWFKSANERHEQDQARADQIDLGQQRAGNVVNKETSDAEHRAAQAQLDTGDLNDLVTDLGKGKF